MTELERTIFVSGISYTSTEESIKEFFSKCGEIERLVLPRY